MSILYRTIKSDIPIFRKTIIKYKKIFLFSQYILRNLQNRILDTYAWKVFAQIGSKSSLGFRCFVGMSISDTRCVWTLTSLKYKYINE